MLQQLQQHQQAQQCQQQPNQLMMPNPMFNPMQINPQQPNNMNPIFAMQGMPMPNQQPGNNNQ